MENLEKTNNKFGYVAILHIDGFVQLHEKVDETQAAPKALDKRDLRSIVIMNQRATPEECVDAVKDKLKKLNDLLESFKQEELINDQSINTRGPGLIQDSTTITGAGI